MSTHQFHFITGLPRSGSTLLAAILRQNPRFYAQMSGPVYGILSAIMERMQPKAEFAPFFTAEKRINVYRGVVENYYADQPNPVIFDTSRAWAGQLPLIANLFPEAKVIACIRDIPWIVDSFERLHQKNFLTPSIMSSFNPNSTVYTRSNYWISPEGIVGYPFDLLKQGYFGEYSDRLLLVPYDSLVKRPAAILSRIHQFLREAPFEYDFDHVEYSADEFDQFSGVSGLHKVHQKVELRPRQTILPPDLFQKLHSQFNWLTPGDTGTFGPKTKATFLS